MYATNLTKLRDNFRPFDYFVDSAAYQCCTGNLFGIKKKAAVLILLRFVENEHWELLLTIRSNIVSRHRGEVAFPGGIKDDKDENPTFTALREAHEEVGLSENLIHLIGNSKPFRTSYDFALYPVFAVLKEEVNFDPVPNAEVRRCFWLPFERFLYSEGHFVKTLRGIDSEFSTNTFEHQLTESNELVEIFGITSFISILFSMITHGTKPKFEFPDHQSFYHNILSVDIKVLNWREVVHIVMCNGLNWRFKSLDKQAKL